VRNEDYDYRTSKPTSIEQPTKTLSPRRGNRLPTNAVASPRFKRRNLKHVHLDAVEEKEKKLDPIKEYEYEEYNKKKKKCLPLKNSASKDRTKGLHGLHHDHQHYRQARQHGQTVAHGQQQQHELTCESTTRVNSRNDSASCNEIDNNLATLLDHNVDSISAIRGRRQKYSSPEKDKNNQIKAISEDQHPGTTCFEPQRRATPQPYNVSERTKDLRLCGSDIYVARLGWKKQTDVGNQTLEADVKDPVNKYGGEPRSLHDELRSPFPTVQPAIVQTAEHATALQSRPCYRCILYIYAAGIKRVFWTNSRGEWEGAKVRDLVDALEAPEGKAQDARGGVDGVFVTKHEVLRLRGMMGV